MPATFNFRTINTTKGFDFLKSLCLLLATTGIVIILVWVPPAVDVTRRVYESGLEVLLFISVIFSVLLSRRGLFWTWVSFLFTIILFLLALLYKWQG